MLVVETIAKIHRAYFSLGKPIKEICRELRMSRKVVRKVIRSDATEFHYERSRQPLPRIGPWRERLELLLEANEGKSAREGSLFHEKEHRYSHPRRGRLSGLPPFASERQVPTFRTRA